MNAFDQLSAMRGPNVTIILLHAQWGKEPSTWTMTYENNSTGTQVKLTVHGPDPEATILAMYERLMAVSKGIPQIAPLGIDYQPHPDSRIELDDDPRDLDDEVPF